MYKYEQVLEESKKYFNGDELAAKVFADKYALKDSENNYFELTPDEMHKRISRELARIESNYANPISEKDIYNLIKNFKYIVPQGSPMSAIGNDHQLQSLSNCFVIQGVNDIKYDSYGGIMLADQQLAQIFKRRGGCGLDISGIRPKGTPTSNAAKTTDGIAVFMERFSNTCREVAMNGRRGALMITIDIAHPEIETFINVKKDKSKVTGANISIKLTDEFMDCVSNDKTYTLRYPTNCLPENAKIKKEVRAKDLWDKIVLAAWESAEPGLLFWDNVWRNTPSDIYKDFGYRSVSTNPCGEINLSPGDACRLLCMNLKSYVKNPFTKNCYFDFDMFDEHSKIAQRLMDDIVDLELETVNKIIDKVNSDPEDMETKKVELDLWKKIYEVGKNGRRTGLGITALGDCLAALNIKYGSDESIEMTYKIYRALAKAAHTSSVIMAKERGSFPIFDYNLEKNHEFLNNIFSECSDEINKMWQVYGRRNIALTTIAPGGSVSMLTQTTSGIEPVFLLSYMRRKKINASDTEARVDFTDHLGDKWQEFIVHHHGVKEWMEVTGETDITKSPYWGATSNDIDWIKSVDIQAAAQKSCCHSISKTCNLPSSATKELVSDVYMRAWKSGCKGFTIYRDGSRTGVLVSTSEKDKKPTEISYTSAPKRPQEMVCDIKKAKIDGESWTIFVGLLDGKPYEVFGGLSKFIDIPNKHKNGKIVKTNSQYNLVVGSGDEELTINDISSVFENKTNEAFTRMISLNLRHGVPIHYVVEQLTKDKYAEMTSFSRVISRVLKTYIKDGIKSSDKACPSCEAKSSLVYQEGCLTCNSCGYSKCS